MRIITRIFIIIFFFACVCYYFDIDMKDVLDGIINIDASGDSEKTKETGKTAVEFVPEPSAAPANAQDAKLEYSGLYEEVIEFIKNQKSDRKLVESYRVLDNAIGGELKGRSYIKDNCLAALALLNHGDEDSKNIALEILKNFSSIQNEDGSWYDFYDISGEVGKLSGKDYSESDTGYNALALYAYSYYTIMTGDRQFDTTMKKSADFILSRKDKEDGGVFDGVVSKDGLKSVRANAYAYFGIREYALANMHENYGEFKEKIHEADEIASWVIENCMDDGTFIKGYAGKEKVKDFNLDSQLMGSLLVHSTNTGEKTGYGMEELDKALSRLYKNISGMEGYTVDSDDKNKSFIWCEGTCKAPLAVMKIDGGEKYKTLLKYIEGYHNMVSRALTPRGIPYSTNVDSAINMVNLESASASAWAALAFQCSQDDDIGSAFFGREEHVFKMVK